MSTREVSYVIVGYDFSKFRDLLLQNDWIEKNEQYIDNKRTGEIQVFDDPMNGDYLYFGYIFSVNKENVTHIPTCSFQDKKKYIDYQLEQMGWTQKMPREPINYEVIVFNEYY